MKLPSCLLIICICTIYIACRKNATTEPAPPHNPADSNITYAQLGLLIKTSMHWTEAEDNTAIYDYDEQGQVIRENKTWFDNSPSLVSIKSQGKRFYRDSLGRIIKIASQGPYSLGLTPPDTVYSTVVYQDVTGNKAAYMVSNHPDNGKIIYDSTFYSYDSANNLVQTTFYESADWPASAPSMQSYETWTYNQTADPVKYEYYHELYTPGVISLVWQYEFEYDDKVNPLYNTDDVRRDIVWTMQHNVTVQHIKSTIIGTYDNVITYQYNSDHKPVLSTLNGPLSTATKYYYSH